MTKRILGVYREERFSNRAVDADQAILDRALDHIAQIAPEIEIIRVHPDKEGLNKKHQDVNLVLSMAQSDEALNFLAKLEVSGVKVMNSTHSIRNCYRVELSKLLTQKTDLSPQSCVVQNIDDIDLCKKVLNKGAWIKRGDFHALADDDVQFCSDCGKLEKIFEGFQEKGVDTLILQEHIEGQIYKFYGVIDRYFSLRYMGHTTKDRYNLETKENTLQVDPAVLENVAFECAAMMDLSFFGGDFIIKDDGSFYLVDMNDWPSFRTCRDEAALHMAWHTLDMLDAMI
jgi:glutathione synthase/RimK-type ligase-like ATP-grasp enzyme